MDLRSDPAPDREVGIGPHTDLLQAAALDIAFRLRISCPVPSHQQAPHPAPGQRQTRVCNRCPRGCRWEVTGDGLFLSLSCRPPTNLPAFLHTQISTLSWQHLAGGSAGRLVPIFGWQPLDLSPSRPSHLTGKLCAFCPALQRDGIPPPCSLPLAPASTTYVLPFRAAVLGPDPGLFDGGQVGAGHSQQRPTTRDTETIG